MTPKCSKCGRTIPGEDVNVARDVAYCRSCNLVNELSALLTGAELTHGVDFSNPPKGVKHDVYAEGLITSATHRSIGAAIGGLAVALFWNGITSIFVLIVTGATLRNMHIPLPVWFPSPEMNGAPMSIGMTIFMWLFLSPFIAIGMMMIGSFLLSIGGRTEIRIYQGKGVVFTGIGPLGYRRRFMVSEVSDVRIEESYGENQTKTNVIIETREGRIIKFGSMLTEERRRFLGAVLHKTLVRHR